jgi:hypothetical protein
VAYCFTGTQFGLGIRFASAAFAGLLYLGVLILAGELGKRDLGALKEALVAKVYSSRVAEAGGTV